MVLGERLVSARRNGRARRASITMNGLSKLAALNPYVLGSGIGSLVGGGLNVGKQLGEIRSHADREKIDPYRLLRSMVVSGGLGAGIAHGSKIDIMSKLKPILEKGKGYVKKNLDNVSAMTENAKNVTKNIEGASKNIENVTGKIHKSRFFGLLAKGK